MVPKIIIFKILALYIVPLRKSCPIEYFNNAIAILDEEIHLAVDSTGTKVYAMGECKTRIYGVSKLRTWHKLYLGVNEATGDIVIAIAATNNGQRISPSVGVVK